MFSIIVAIAKNNAIGKDNKLLCHLPEDLKRFKRITEGKTIIMGQKTFESLEKVLPGRKHIVLSNTNDINIDNENVILINDIKLLDDYKNSLEEYFIIGGGTIYKLLMPYTEKMYITKINQDFEADVFFPEINIEEWNILEKQKGIKDENNPFDYEYITYVRKK